MTKRLKQSGKHLLYLALLVLAFHPAHAIRIPTFDEVRKEAEKKTGIQVDVPTPGDVAKGAQKIGGDLVRAGGSVISETGKVLNNANKEVNVFRSNISNEGNKGLENLGREANKGLGDVIKTVQKAGKDIEKTAAKTGKDIEANIAKSGRDVEDAAHAIGKYIERSAQGVGNSADKTLERMREGKFVDAIWHHALSPLQNTEENAALAAQESSLIRTVGQVAASAYGGPGGAAAYAAWLTYKQTGSLDMALRVGLITGATAVAFQSAGKIPTDVEYGLLRKTLVTAAIGGGAIAASGGSADDVRDGFLSAGAMVLVQDHYQKVTKEELDRKSMKPSKPGPAYCIGQTTKNCAPVPKNAILKKEGGVITEVDRSKLDSKVASVGIEGSKNPIAGDNSVPMKLVSKVPGMQGMSLMHDSWVTNTLPPLLNQPTIVPAIVIYYTGTGAPYYGHLQKTAVEHAIEKQAKADKGKGKDAPSASLGVKAQPSTAVDEQQPVAGTDYTDSYVCGNAREERSWLVAVNKPNEATACRLEHEYQTSVRKKVSESFRHFEDTKICEANAIRAVKKALDEGMTCMHLRSGPGSKKSS